MVVEVEYRKEERHRGGEMGGQGPGDADHVRDFAHFLNINWKTLKDFYLGSSVIGSESFKVCSDGRKLI